MLKCFVPFDKCHLCKRYFSKLMHLLIMLRSTKNSPNSKIWFVNFPDSNSIENLQGGIFSIFIYVQAKNRLIYCIKHYWNKILLGNLGNLVFPMQNNCIQVLQSNKSLTKLTTVSYIYFLISFLFLPLEKAPKN